ncbi:TPA: HEPN domain-containing protein [Vibrio parahaemolyticus]|nr:HEPN domain-containing protein [Vibrio parahaemolyticus]HBC3519366.1 HEPN domain-containing protein [Vibrio parahaemolyticus]
MSVESTAFYEFAQRIMNDWKDEMTYRVCISKSYYCAYHSVKKQIQHLPSYVGVGVHQSLIEYLQSPSTSDVPCKDIRRLYKRLSYILRAQRDSRVIADYHLNSEVSRKDAEDALNTTKSILKLCDEVDSAAA